MGDEIVDGRSARGKLAQLHRLLASFPSAVVAFSGGADSAFLAFMARRALGDKALAITAESASLAPSELREARTFARDFGIPHRIIETHELEDERYSKNGPDRCYLCKDALMDALEAITRATGSGEILVGVNVDDLGDYRPGQAAVADRGGRWPLVVVGLSKAEIRWLSRELGLTTWNKPAAACLSSRIAYGVRVTPEALRRIDRSEEALRALGISGQIRVRDQGRNLARIEIDPEGFDLLMERREEVVAALKDAGFTFVVLDLEGYRMGSHNAGLRELPLLMAGQATEARRSGAVIPEREKR